MGGATNALLHKLNLPSAVQVGSQHRDSTHNRAGSTRLTVNRGTPTNTSERTEACSQILERSET